MNKTVLLCLMLGCFFISGCKKDEGAKAAQNETPTKSTIYYFHGNKRCISCMKIEQYTKEVYLNNFKDKLDFMVLNTDEPENNHFILDYNLYTKSVVLVKIKDGKEAGHKNLDKVWNYLGNEGVFKEYVKSEIDGFLLGNDK